MLNYLLIINLFKMFINWWHFDNQVEENVAAALDLGTAGKDEETLSELEAMLKPVKNQTWPSGIQQR
jgi:hypothetical protein